MSDYLALYRSYLTTEKRMSANTVSSYMRDLSQYDEWLKQKKTDLKRAKNVLLQEYVKRLEQLGKSPATMSRFLASSKSFYAYMFSKGYIKTNPTAALKAKKVQRKYPEILTNKEVELFLEQPKCVDEKGFRDHAMLELLYATGIRVSELRFITAETLASGRTEIRLKGKCRTVLLPQELAERLRPYARAQDIQEGPLFRTRTGRPLDRSNIWHEMKTLCREAGVAPEKVFPHNLRHLFAKIFYERDHDLVRLADYLGHSSVETTRRYTIISSREACRRQLELGLLIDREN